MAAKGSTDPDGAFRRWAESLSGVGPDEVKSLRPLRIQVVVAGPADTADEMARRMVVPDRPLDRFLVLNELERGAVIRAGQSYKLVVE